MLAYDLFFLALHCGLGAELLELGVFFNVVRSHSVQYEIGLVGHSNDVVFAGMG